MSFSYKTRIVKELDSFLEKKISDFRKSNSDMRGKYRTEKELKEHFEKYCSVGDIKKWILVFEKDDLLGMTAIFRREINIDDRNTWLGGIGKVRVREDQRKKGLASMMMDVAMEQLEELNCDVAYLCTNLDSFLVEFYKKYGFVLLNKKYTYLSKSGKKYTGNNGMLAPINSAQIFQSILNSDKIFDIGVGNW